MFWRDGFLSMRHVAIVAAIFAFFIFIATSAVQARSLCVTKAGYPAALSKKLLKRAVRYAVEKDYVAFAKLLDTKMVFILKGGVRVYLEGGDLLGGIVKIRLPGSTVPIWTLVEAVDCNQH